VIKVVLIDDHLLVRTGIRKMLAGHNIEIIGEAGNGNQAIQMVRHLLPDLIILDVKLPDISGLEVTHKILSYIPSAKILIVSSIQNNLFPFRLLEAGARGYITKNSSQEELLRAIQTVHRNQRYISPEIAQILALSRVRPADGKGDLNELSDRETEVMYMVIRGVGIKEIANKLHLSSKTVHSYRSRIFEKLNLRNDTELTLLAIKRGIITLEEAGKFI
jgi:two-component system, NarL family, invasion response regulator UvrY